MELVLLISQVLGGGTALGHPHELPVTVEGLLCSALLWLVQVVSGISITQEQFLEASVCSRLSGA